MDDLSEDIQQRVESEYVKCTYDSIAQDFSNTRYKKWPKVDNYLKSLPLGNLLLDVGCGNGKYLDNQSTLNIGCDISANLLSICRQKGFEVVQCDMARLPFRTGIFDSIISVAALHHVVTAKRREECLRKQTELLEPRGGSMLIQVWAFEQKLEEYNPYLKSVAPDVTSPSRQVIIDKDVAIPVHKNRTQFKSQDVLVPFHTKTAKSELDTSTCSTEVIEKERLRYYHLFKQGELDRLIGMVPGVSVVESYYDCGNWCSILRRQVGS